MHQILTNLNISKQTLQPKLNICRLDAACGPQPEICEMDPWQYLCQY